MCYRSHFRLVTLILVEPSVPCRPVRRCFFSYVNLVAILTLGRVVSHKRELGEDTPLVNIHFSRTEVLVSRSTIDTSKPVRWLFRLGVKRTDIDSIFNEGVLRNLSIYFRRVMNSVSFPRDSPMSHIDLETKFLHSTEVTGVLTDPSATLGVLQHV